MPFAIALLTSALVHVAALFSPGWALPGFEEVEESQSLDAVLAQTSSRPATPPARAAATSRPVPEKPRRSASSTSTNTTTTAVSPAPTFEAPVESVVAPEPEPPQATAAKPLPQDDLADADGPKIALPAKGRVR